jgi:rubrerythrin
VHDIYGGAKEMLADELADLVREAQVEALEEAARVAAEAAESVRGHYLDDAATTGAAEVAAAVKAIIERSGGQPLTAKRRADRPKQSTAPAWLECEHCGDVAIESTSGFFCEDDGDGRCATCRFPGHVSVDEGVAQWATDQDGECSLVGCDTCHEVECSGGGHG